MHGFNSYKKLNEPNVRRFLIKFFKHEKLLLASVQKTLMN